MRDSSAPAHHVLVKYEFGSIKYFLQATAVKDKLKLGGQFTAGMAQCEKFYSYITVELVAYHCFLL